MKFYSFASHSRTTAQLSRGRVRPVQHVYRGAQCQRAREHELPRDLKSSAPQSTEYIAISAAAAAATTATTTE